MKKQKEIFIPYGRQNITQKDIDCVVKVLKSPMITQGPVVSIFENKTCPHNIASILLFN